MPESPLTGADPVEPAVRHWTGRQLLLWTAGLVALICSFLLLPLPDADQLRDWTDEAGAAAIVVYLVAHVLVTVFPFPRVAFTLAAGLLFTSALGVLVAWLGAVGSALLAFVIVRRLGRRRVEARMDPELLATVDERLRDRGAVAVASLRLIAVIPFSLINYSSAVSGVSFRDYFVGSTIGILPGTIALVLLGDAISGNQPPGLIAISVVCGILGFSGLIWEFGPVVRKLRARDSNAM